jgi:protease-4
MDGFGYDLKYEFDGKFDLFNPSDGNVGYGFLLYDNAYAGLKLNKRKSIDMGLLYRPHNLISLGIVKNFNDGSTGYDSTIFGIAIRPFLKHQLTMGADFIFNTDDELNYFPHFSLQPIDGINISGKANQDFNDFQFTIRFNFGKESVFLPSTYNDANELNGGIGFYTSSQKEKSLFKKKAKDTKKLIRMKLSGLFIEEQPVDASFFDQIFNNPEKGIQLRAWIDEIDSYTEDPEIDGMIIDIGHVRAHFSKRGEIYSALKRFKAANKKIYVYADKGISNTDYLLISMADEIYLNEYTGIDLTGLRVKVTFFRGFLDTLLIVPEVFRVEHEGKSYKTAADPFLNRKMSDEMQENYSELGDDLYTVFVNYISEGRNWDENHTREIIDNGPYFIPQDAIAAGLADSIMYPDQFNDYIKSLNEEKIEIIKWEDIDRSDEYVHEWSPKKKEKIAIIYAVGGIVSGKSDPGPSGSSTMGDETIIKAIKSARENDDIKAILLRIDSGGGSGLASDQMWHEVKKTTDISSATTEKDSSNIKPFIASMSGVAASGGYYIACQADTIVAHPATITGSIGVIGLRLNLSKLLNKIGIRSDIIKNGEHSDFADGSRLVSDDERKRIQASINNMYEKFKDKVIAGRDNMPEDANLDDVALGRVFTGQRAKDGISIPLVDVTGGLHDAIELTKAAAGLEGEEVEIVEYPMPDNKYKAMVKQLTTMRSKDYTDLLPEKIAEEFEVLDIIPILLDDEIQMILPYHITIE